MIHLISSEVYFEPLQTSKMELFAKIVNGLKLLTNFAKCSILDVCRGSKYTMFTHVQAANFHTICHAEVHLVIKSDTGRIYEYHSHQKSFHTVN